MTNSKTAQISIRQWNKHDRPIEKLLTKGKSVLSDAELLAILIRTGSRAEGAVDLAKRILLHSDNQLNRLAKLDSNELMQFTGIGKVKAIAIIAALELGRRRSLELAIEKPQVSSSAAVFQMMQPLIGDLPHEEFWILYLNNANKIERQEQLSKGGITATLVDVRLIYKTAISFGATNIILCHNHPSGNLQPSKADDKLTKKIVKAGLVLDIRVLDHIIISENSFYSFADEDRL